MSINADDLLAVFVSENPRLRTEAIERLIEAAWKRGWEDALKAHGITSDTAVAYGIDSVRRSILEDEIEFGLI